MQVRSLEIDFSSLEPHWSRYIDFAQSMNANSTVPAYVEPYLAKVLARARKALAQNSPELTRDISLFVRQEMEHCRQHNAFNEMVVRSYPQIVPELERYGADYERFLRTRSLQFNVAYSEGFESMFGLTTPVQWRARDVLWADSDPRVEALWKWHLAEEHEHREVMLRVYHALYGRGARAYAFRIYGFIYAMVHIGGHVRRTQKALLRIDRARMGEEAWKARARPPRQPKGIGQFVRAFAQVLSPGYDPSTRQPLDGLSEILAEKTIRAPLAGATHRSS